MFNTRQVKTPSRQVWRVPKSGWGEGGVAGLGGPAQQLVEKEAGVGGLLLSWQVPAMQRVRGAAQPHFGRKKPEQGGEETGNVGTETHPGALMISRISKPVWGFQPNSTF